MPIAAWDRVVAGEHAGNDENRNIGSLPLTNHIVPVGMSFQFELQISERHFIGSLQLGVSTRCGNQEFQDLIFGSAIGAHTPTNSPTAGKFIII